MFVEVTLDLCTALLGNDIATLIVVGQEAVEVATFTMRRLGIVRRYGKPL